MDVDSTSPAPPFRLLHCLPAALACCALLMGTRDGLAQDAPPPANSAAASESAASGAEAGDADSAGDAEDPAAKKELFTGQVVFLLDAFKKRGIRATDEIRNQVVLETESGELIPIVPDWRGRAFYQDKRLRDRKVQLVAVRQEGVPYLQVLMIFLFDEQGQRHYMDYWCDICSIPMYEIKPCDCCQGDIELRLQPRELPAYLQTPASSP